jgi:hypothetical protein
MESLLGVSLTLRGAQVEYLLCDGVLPACMGCEFWYLGRVSSASVAPLSQAFCSTCFEPANRAYGRLGFPVHRFSDCGVEADIDPCRAVAAEIPREDIPGYVFEDLPVGEQAYAGALRFYARGDLENEPQADAVLRQYLVAALITARAFSRFLDTHEYDCAVFNHGIYIPQGIIGAICRQRGIRVVNWNPAYRKKCFIFSHEDTYHHTMVSEPTGTWENIDWDSRREECLMGYLSSRWQGTGDWIWFHDKPLLQVEEGLSRMGVDPSKPCIGLLTSVMWDAALHYPSNAFPDMLSWAFHSIDYFIRRRDLQLIIRIHPAEIQGGLPSRQRMLDEIQKHYPALPANVFVIPPQSRLSTYALMQKCNAAIIYNTKTGIELAPLGIPVVVAGEAWIRNKGFSIDVKTPREYTEVLDRLPLTNRMTPTDVLRAKKYAYHFFFRRMIPLESMEPASGNPPYRLQVENLDMLLPGKSPGLDLICDGILKGTEFIYEPPELIHLEAPA